MNLIARYVSNLLHSVMSDPSRLLDQVRVALRFYSVWRRSLQERSNSLVHRIPWVTFEARSFIEMILTTKSIVFEYGSGGSTVFYSRRVQRVVSVEHDEHWFNLVKACLGEERITNCDYSLVPPEPAAGFHNPPDNIEGYVSSDEAYSGLTFRSYAASIDRFPDRFFDLIAVDGRARPSCVAHALRKVKVGGYLMLDNSERPHYRKGKDLLSGWERRVFFGPGPYNAYFWETTIWKRVSN